jgi:hypothetical protein
MVMTPVGKDAREYQPGKSVAKGGAAETGRGKKKGTQRVPEYDHGVSRQI